MNMQSFSDTDETSRFYPGGNRRFLLEQIEHLARYSDSVIVISGIAGMGKSTLAKALLLNRAADTEITLFDDLSSCNEIQLLGTLAEKLDLPVFQDDGVIELRAKIAEYCWEQNEQALHNWLILDNAEELDSAVLAALFELLEECVHLRLIVMVQPQFVDVIERNRPKTTVLQTLNLEPFSREETAEYLNYCYGTTDHLGESEFNPQAVDYIARQADGVPGNIDNLVNELRTGNLPESKPAARFPRKHFFVLLLLALAIAVSLLIPHRDEEKLVEQRVASPLGTTEIDKPIAAPEGYSSDRALSPLDFSKSESENPARKPSAIELSGSLEEGISESESARQHESATGIADKELPDEDTDETQEDQFQAVSGIEKSQTAPQIATGTAEDFAVRPAAPRPDKPAQPGEPKHEDTVASQAETKPGSKSESEKFYYRASGKTGGSLTEAEARILQWDRKAFLVQLHGTYSRARAEQYLRDARPLELLYFQKSHNNQPWYTVVYGVFATRDEALEAVQQLPPDLPVNQPWVRQLEAVQEEISRARALD